MAKNTRIVYIDPKNIEVYAKLSNEDFKEFFMTYLTYQEGDDVSKTISNPYIQALFMAGYADKIIANETKWENKARTNRENGKKGGRPKKNPQIEANTGFDNENDIIPQPIEESVSEEQEMGKIGAITISPEVYEDEEDFRYGEIDTSDPNVSFLREDDEVFTKQETEPINEQKNKKDMDYTEAAKKYIEQMDGITFNSPEWHQRLYSIIKESEPPFRWGAIYDTINKIMKNAA